jgi:hypothetical protein
MSLRFDGLIARIMSTRPSGPKERPHANNNVKDMQQGLKPQALPRKDIPRSVS